MQVAELNTPAKCITFQNAKADDIKFIRKKLIDMIKLANDYSGSNMEKAIKEYEASLNAVNDSNDEQEQQEEEKPQTTKPAKKTAKKVEPTPDDSEDGNEPW